MEFIIVTGLSGAGKSKALDLMEDIGYYCVDNMPPQLIPNFAAICRDMEKVAIGADIRNSDDFGQTVAQIKALLTSIPESKLLFMDCKNDVLVKRFKETRRRHPLMSRMNGSISEMVESERAILAPLFDMADYIVDTSATTIGQLWNILSGYLLGADRDIEVQITSFGFKKGVPNDCDFIFDMRALPNPFYIEALKNKTGLDEDVDSYVFSFKETMDYFDKVCEMLASLLPLFVKEGRATLVIGIGCTGGRHRSVCFAQRLKVFFENCGKKTTVRHREL